jgi:hypothetical protein
LGLFFLKRGQFPPPTLKKSLLDVRETTVRVVLECFDDGVQNVPDGGVLDGVVGAAEIFVDGFQPPHIVVRVGYEVDRQGP